MGSCAEVTSGKEFGAHGVAEVGVLPIDPKQLIVRDVLLRPATQLRQPRRDDLLVEILVCVPSTERHAWHGGSRWRLR